MSNPPTTQPGAVLYTQGFGSRPENVEIPHIDVRDPTTTDVRYPQGKQWINQTDNREFVLTSLSSQGGELTANWEVSGGGDVLISTLTPDSGGAVSPVDNNINLFGGTGLNTVGTTETITFNVVGGGVKTTVVTADTPMAVNTGYITNKAGTAATMTLPDTAAVGDIVLISGLGATSYVIAQNAGDTIRMNGSSSTTGVAGTATPTSQYQTILLRCIVANTDWTIAYSSDVVTLA